MPTLQEVLERARGSVRAAARRHHGGRARATGEVDQRWYWAAPILLDLERDAASARAWLGQANLPRSGVARRRRCR